jgi:hypothetical protein
MERPRNLDMLRMHPNCQCCDTDLPADSPGAMICSFECTFCLDCAESLPDGRCPNCGGDLVSRPMRTGRHLVTYPASSERIVRELAC